MAVAEAAPQCLHQAEVLAESLTTNKKSLHGSMLTTAPPPVLAHPPRPGTPEPAWGLANPKSNPKVHPGHLIGMPQGGVGNQNGSEGVRLPTGVGVADHPTEVETHSVGAVVNHLVEVAVEVAARLVEVAVEVAAPLVEVVDHLAVVAGVLPILRMAEASQGIPRVGM